LKTIGTVLATYNGEKYLEEQLDSIVNQSLKPNTIIIIDDCSTDATTTIIGRYREKYPEMIIYEENQRNLGPKQTFERGISICETDYIALSDQDDIWESEKIERCYCALEQNEGAKLCFHDFSLINEKGTPFAQSFWESALAPLPVSGAEARKRLANLTNIVSGCAMFFSSDLKQYLLPMPDSEWSLHDWWIAVVAFFLANPIIVREALTRYRFHDDQVCSLAVAAKVKRKKRSFRDVPYKIRREVRRIIFRKEIAGMRLQETKERQRDLSQDVLRAIDMYETLNCNHISKEELSDLKDIVESNIKASRD
jgi:glycosyltransferase involved in cell wall biosynthesis